MTALTLYISLRLIAALSASEADRSSSETMDEEVEAGPRSEKETERSSGWGGGGGGEREGSVFECSMCVGVYSLTLKCFPAGDGSFSQTTALDRVTCGAQARINTKTYVATCR